MKLVIVDDDPLILKSLELTLSRETDIQVVGCASDGSKALTVCQEKLPDIVLMDIRMPGVDGISATRLIKQRFPNIRIMMLTTFDDKPNIQQALAAGADGYLIKTDKIADIAGKLRIMIDGTSVLGADVLKKLATETNPSLDELTERERDITRLVAQGLTNKEIANHLFLSEGTVRNNIVVIMEKLNITNRTQLGLAYYGKITTD
ncbi:MAG: response regulator transcription factor [Defluviitaleaceae bacterium]|nr:response regulator transcription factor [Defluviitaleaceae bacterium]